MFNVLRFDKKCKQTFSEKIPFYIPVLFKRPMALSVTPLTLYIWLSLPSSIIFHNFSFSSNLLSVLYWSVLAEFSVSWCMFSYQNVIWRVQRTAVYLWHQLHCTVILIAYNPKRVAGDVYASLLSWISGLSFDSPLLSLVFFPST